MRWFRTRGEVTEEPVTEGFDGDERTAGDGAEGSGGRWSRWRRRGPKVPREARPRARRGSFRRAALIWGIVVSLLTAGLVFLFFYSAAFVVKDIKVTGVKGETAETVVDLARIPHGRPLARVSESRVQERVLEDVRFADVRVHRSWPSTVTFEVSLRTPALALRHGDTYWLCDAGGVVYDSRGKAPKKVPVIRVAEAPQDLTSDTVRGLLDLLATKPANKALEGKLSTPVLDKDGTVSMRVEQLRIEWGAPVDAEKKWAVVTALVGQDAIDPEGGIPQTIDVRLPDQPVVSGLPPAQG